MWGHTGVMASLCREEMFHKDPSYFVCPWVWGRVREWGYEGCRTLPGPSDHCQEEAEAAEWPRAGAGRLGRVPALQSLQVRLATSCGRSVPHLGL